MTFELFLAIRQEYMILIMYGVSLFLTLLFIIYYSDKLTFMVSFECKFEKTGTGANEMSFSAFRE